MPGGAEGVRDDRSERARDELRTAADRVAESLAAMERSWPDRDEDWDAYLRHANDPAYVRLSMELTLTRVLRQALDRDPATAQRIAEQLPAFGLAPDDTQTAAVLRDLAYYVVHGMNA
ncbi:hypothetical protein ACTMTI_43875 [Nonomuraea sp. H19]|uniref:hypothetical protein n=1 Tax=Nonomuraea sp. H19 TaxID=3452206 RepID=UPI003F8CB881